MGGIENRAKINEDGAACRATCTSRPASHDLQVTTCTSQQAGPSSRHCRPDAAVHERLAEMSPLASRPDSGPLELRDAPSTGDRRPR